MRLLPPAAKLLATAALPLVLVACSSDSDPGSGASAASTAPAPAGTASGTPTTTADADPDAGLLTGRQLKAALAPASFFPSGFVLDAGGSRDTGDTYAF